MQRGDHIGWTPGECGVDRPDIGRHQSVGIFAAGPDRLSNASVAEHRQRHLVQLNVAGTHPTELRDLLAVHLREIREQRL